MRTCRLGIIEDMNNRSNEYEKYTETLRDWLNDAHDDDRTAEVIVRLLDPYALERPRSWSAKGAESVERGEQQHADQGMESLVEFIHKLEDKGEKVSLLGTSWLTHSALVKASPSVVEKLSEREDVDLIDVNTEVQSRIRAIP